MHKQVKRVKGADIYMPPLTGKPEQQRFTGSLMNALYAVRPAISATAGLLV